MGKGGSRVNKKDCKVRNRRGKAGKLTRDDISIEKNRRKDKKMEENKHRVACKR